MTESYAKMQMYPILEEVELVVEEPAENEDCEYCWILIFPFDLSHKEQNE